MRSLRRKSTRSLVNSVYVPTDSRDNHYLLAKLPVADLVSKFTDHNEQLDATQLVRFVSHKLFSLCREYGIANAFAIAKPKLVRVRFANEYEVVESADQFLVFYNPKHTLGYKYFVDHDAPLTQLSILFLAEGQELRSQAADFHQKVSHLLTELGQELKLSGAISLKDHQHITFEQNGAKSEQGTRAHGFRYMAKRYQDHDFIVPNQHSYQSHLVVKFTMYDLLASQDVDLLAAKPYQAWLENLTHIVQQELARFDIETAWLVASGQTPIVRNTPTSEQSQEIAWIDFTQSGLKTIARSEQVAGPLYLVFPIVPLDDKQQSHAKQVNQVLQCITSLRNCLYPSNLAAEFTVRFYQHLSYDLLQKGHESSSIE